MTPDNLSTLTMAPADKTTILAAIDTLATACDPYSANIPAADKKNYAFIGTSRAGMDEVFIRSMTDNPTLVPSFVALANVNTVSLRGQLPTPHTTWSWVRLLGTSRWFLLPAGGPAPAMGKPDRERISLRREASTVAKAMADTTARHVKDE